MLAKQFRLPSSVSFEKSRSFQEQSFVAKVLPNELPHNRYGFIVSKAIDKKATRRNKLKRVFRSIIEEKWLKKGKGKDILFILRPHIQKLTREEMVARIDDVMKKIIL